MPCGTFLEMEIEYFHVPSTLIKILINYLIILVFLFYLVKNKSVLFYDKMLIYCHVFNEVHAFLFKINFFFYIYIYIDVALIINIRRTFMCVCFFNFLIISWEGGFKFGFFAQYQWVTRALIIYMVIFLRFIYY